MPLVLAAPTRNPHYALALLGALEGASLHGRVTPRVVGGRSGRRTAREILAHLADGPGVIGMSLYSEQLDWARELCTALAARPEESLLLAGGPHASALPEELLALGVDAVVPGEGECVFTRLLARLLAGEDWRGGPGLVYQAGGELVRTEPAAPVDLNALPPLPLALRKYGPIEITRGCPHGCTYCQTPRLMGRRVRHRSVDAIAEAVSVMVRRRLMDIRFVTPNALSFGSPDGVRLNLPTLEELLRTLREILGPKGVSRNGKRPGRLFFGSFPSEVRPEHVTPETMDLIDEYCDNDNVVLGAQTGSPRLLAAIKRGHTVDDVVRAVGLIQATGRTAYVDVIFGLPGETEGDVALTMDLLRELTGQGARVHGHTFMPLPGTPLAGVAFTGLSPAARRAAGELSRQGLLFGQWQRQEQAAIDFSRRLLAGLNPSSSKGA